MGYTKSVIPLEVRCPGAVLTSNKPIGPGLEVEDFYVIHERRSEKNLTPLEVAIKIWQIEKWNSLID
jgi:hypothetical protein